MLILDSDNAHDYYDSVSKTTGVDTSVIYRRNERVFCGRDIEKLIELYNTRDDRFFRFNDSVLLVCGDAYPLHVAHNYRTETNDIIMIADYDKAMAYIKGEYAFNVKNDRLTYFDKKKLSSKLKGLDKYWNSISNASKDSVMEYHNYYKSPLILQYEILLRGLTFVVDVNLSNNDLTFLPVYDIYQKIYMYISNQAQPDNKMVEISDKHKLSAHGFDSKQSFRHRIPSTKKRKQKRSK